MNKKNLVVACCLCLGCSVNYNAVPVPEPVPAPMARRFIALGDIRNGLKRSEVKSLLGEKIVVGYELTDPDAQQYQPITRDNPYRTGIYQEGGKEYTVDFYLLGVAAGDGQVSDDELAPMVFQDDVLVAQGWEYFRSKIKSAKE